MQWTRVEHHKASVNGIIMVRNDPPDTLVLFPMNTQNLRLEQRFLVKTVMRGNPFRVLQQFRLMRVLFRRNITRLFEQRHVDETLNVALGAGISVPPPTSQQEMYQFVCFFLLIHIPRRGKISQGGMIYLPSTTETTTLVDHEKVLNAILQELGSRQLGAIATTHDQHVRLPIDGLARRLCLPRVP